MDGEVERKIRDLEDKFRIDLGRAKVELIKISSKSDVEHSDRLRLEIKQSIRRMVQEELMYFKRENFTLQRQITAMQQHIDSQRWNEKKNERRFLYEIEMLKNHIKDMSEQFLKTQENSEIERRQRY
jgi:hypothetical protein